MPGPISKSYDGPSGDAPYIPDWCYSKGPKMCTCGHHEGYHNSNGICLFKDSCGCVKLPEECFTKDSEL